jgi:hypothetical protein
MSTHWEMTSARGRSHLRRTFPAFAEALVEIILAGVQVQSGSAVLVPVDNDGAGSSKLDKRTRRGKRQ